MSDKWDESARKRAEQYVTIQALAFPYGTAVFLQIDPSREPVCLGVATSDHDTLRGCAVGHLAHLIRQLEDERREAAAGEDW
jgi:hypothetical protein